ncbi:MAG: LysM peptidoglycan-binding domain-containing protein [Anaerolineae bacterium]
MRKAVAATLVAFLLVSSALAQEGGPYGGGCVISEPPERTGDNLLYNPSFEWPYYYEWQEAGVGNGCIPAGWTHWYLLDENGKDGEYKIPEWKPVHREREPLRVRDGNTAMDYYKPWALHIAGVHQTVDVPEGSTLRFTAWGMAWSSHLEHTDPQFDQYNSFAGGQENYVFMRIGVDPQGKGSPFSDTIVWSDVKTPLDVYDMFAVEVTAEASQVTVVLWSNPQYPARTVDVFWDDTSLSAVDAQGNTLPAPETDSTDASVTDEDIPDDVTTGTVDSLEGVIPAEAQPLREDGSQWHTVQPLDTLLRIAAAYDVEPQTIRDLNNLTSDTLFVDQELLIVPAEEDEGTAFAEDMPEEEAPELAEAGGESDFAQLCLALFADADSDGQWEQGEALIGGGDVAVQGAATRSSTTESTGEPTCFADLPPGDYTVSVSPPDGFSLANTTPLALSLSAGSEIALNVSALADSPESAEQAPVETAPAARQGMFARPLVVGLLIGGIGLLATSGVTALIVLRSSTADSGNTRDETTKDEDEQSNPDE